MDLKKYKPYANYCLLFSLIPLILSYIRFYLDSRMTINIYLLLFISLILLSSGLILKFRNLVDFLKSRKGKKGVETSIRLFLVLAIMIAVYLVFYFNIFTFKLDITENKIYSLSSQTIEALEKLNEKIEIIVFDVKFEGDQLYSLLKEYKAASDKISYKYINAVKEPFEAQKYKVRKRGTIIFKTADENFTTLTRDDMKKTILNEYRQKETEYRYEQKITATILSLIETKKSICYFLEGHGEKSISDQSDIGLSKIVSEMKIENITSKKLNLLITQKIPSDANVIIIAGPTSKIYPEEQKHLLQFIKNGGRLFILSDPIADTGITGIEILIGKLGIILHDDMVIDPVNHAPALMQIEGKVIQGSPAYPIVKYAVHEIVNELSQKELITLFMSSRSMHKAENISANYIYNTIITTSKYGWGEKDYKLRNPEFNKGKDYQGPVDLAALIHFTVDQDKSHTNNFSQGRMAVFGDSDFICNLIAEGPGHKDLFINTIRWLLNQEKNITIRPKKQKHPEIYLSGTEQFVMRLLFILIIPLIIIIIGIIVYVRRKKIIKLIK